MEQLKPSSRKADKIHAPVVQSNSLVSHDIILFFAGKLSGLNEKRKAAAKEVDLCRKQMKNAGIPMGVFDMVVKLAEEDPDVAFAKMQDFQHVSNAFALPIGIQMALFENPSDKIDNSFEAQIARAKLDGRSRAIADLACDDEKYHPNTPLGLAHYDGWDEGQKVYRDMFLDTNKKARQDEADKQTLADEKARKKADKLAKKEGAEVRSVPANDDGETVQ